MNISDRILETEQKFDKLNKQKQEIEAELIRLQGEWRVLKEIEKTESPKVEIKNEGKKK